MFGKSLASEFSNKEDKISIWWDVAYYAFTSLIIIYLSFVITYFWHWFLVPIVPVHDISVFQAWGLIMLLGTFILTPFASLLVELKDFTTEDSLYDKWIKRGGYCLGMIFGITASFVWGWVIHFLV